MELMPGDIPPPKGFESMDYCLYQKADDNAILVVRIDTPIKVKQFDDMDKAQDYLYLQTRMRESIGWISLDQGKNWTGYPAEAIEAVKLN